MNGSSNGAGERPPVALVLPGGGARGAYEAGALSVLLPALEDRGERVQIICSDWSHDFDVDPAGIEASREVESLREFRDLRRR